MSILKTIIRLISDLIARLSKSKANDGVIPEKPSITDYILGERTLIVPEIINDGSWEKYLSKPYEAQYVGFDQQNCVTQAGINCLEAQLNYMLMNNLFPPEIDYAFEQFFCKDGYVKLSTRFTAKMAGTQPWGLRMTDFWDSIRKHGFVPLDLWPDPVGKFNWNEYYKEIPDDIKKFAENVGKLFDTKYEWAVAGNCNSTNIPLLKTALKQAPLQVAWPSCPRDYAGIQRPCGTCVGQHAVTIYNIGDFIEVLDSYPSYLRKNSLNYPAPWVIRGVIKIKE